MDESNSAKYFHYRIKFFVAEFLGTAILLMAGLSIVILMFGVGSPMADYIPEVKVRQSLTGFLFGSVGACIALSPIGKFSGAHVNPVVTLAFWVFGKIEGRLTITYIAAQFCGAVFGCLPLLLWGKMGESINFGATVPGQGYTFFDAFLGELITTFFLVFMLIVFIGFRELRRFTPFMVPFLYAIMVPIEADVSGISTNPARSFGPAVVSGEWMAWWIYWIGPLAGTFLACVMGSRIARRIRIAKLYYFDSHNEEDELIAQTNRSLVY